MRVHAPATITLSVLGALMYGGQVANRAVHAHRTPAPCTDAIAAFLDEHWECSRLAYDSKRGLHFVCIGDDYTIEDSGITDTGRKRLVAFIYTNLTTLKQGSCDCDKPYGPACENLE